MRTKGLRTEVIMKQYYTLDHTLLSHTNLNSDDICPFVQAKTSKLMSMSERAAMRQRA